MFFKIESKSATMYKVDTLLMMNEAVTATVIAFQPAKKPLVQMGCVNERATIAIARATKVRAMQTWVGSFLNSFMYLSEITAPTHEITTLRKAKIVPMTRVLISASPLLASFFPH